MVSDIPRPAFWYGYGGLIPFYAGALALWILPVPEMQLAWRVLIGYAAIILSFLGAVHWGLALANYGAPPPRAGDAVPAMTWARLGWAVIPALIGWVALVLEPAPALILLIAAFAAAFLADRGAARAGVMPEWYPSLRGPLTLLVVLALALSLARAATAV